MSRRPDAREAGVDREDDPVVELAGSLAAIDIELDADDLAKLEAVQQFGRPLG